VGKKTEVVVPDIGGFHDVPIVDIPIKVGESVKKDDPLITLESDKASMDVPSLFDGIIQDVRVHVGDKVSAGSSIAVIELLEAAERRAVEAAPPARAEPDAAAPSPAHPAPPPPAPAHPAPPPPAPAPALAREEGTAAPVPPPAQRQAPWAPSPGAQAADLGPAAEGPTRPARQLGMPPAEPRPAGARPPPAAALAAEPRPHSHASPAIRRLAREMGVDVTQVTGTGPNRRIRQDDLKRFVNRRLTGAPAVAPAAPPEPLPDFARFGRTETQPLGRIRRLSAARLQRAWTHIPHVTQHGEADITELEAFRKAEAESARERGVRLTLLAFLMKAAVQTLKAHPTCNASLDASGENLIVKHYFHLGFAVDTAEGLLVPVLREVDRKGILDIAAELGEVSTRARNRKLGPDDMQGASFTISSLGGIGGTAFSPIINAPEVAILGVSRAEMKPVFRDGGFVPRLMLPLALSYDHRVIDGAEGARFMVDLCRMLGDTRRLLL
jgi:pyruvate dehydrogenase E2 component (dihydrolipoamide acetyltransferase)